MNTFPETAPAISQTRGAEKTTDPVVSIVLLAYNHEPYLRKSIEGFLAQKASFPFELIIGEDCSPDKTREIALEYERKFPHIVRVITSEKNVGAHANLRRCEEAARGRYMCYCDGDDYWIDPQKLEREVGFLEAHPDYAMVHNAFQMYYLETGRMVPDPLRLPADLDDANGFEELLSGRRHVWPLTVCIRRSMQDAVLRECPECYDPRFIMADTQRWLEVSRRGKVKYFSGPVAVRQVLAESMTKSKNPGRVLKFAFSNKEIFHHYIAKYGCSAETKKKTIVRCAHFLLTSACAAGDVQTARAALADYRSVGAPIPLDARLYAWGSHGSLLRNILVPIVSAMHVAQKVFRRLGRTLKPA